MKTDETEFEIIDGQTGERMSVEQKLQAATSGEEIQRLLTFGNGCKPSGSVRRRWLRAAAQAYERIRQARCAPDMHNLPDSNSSRKAHEPTSSVSAEAGADAATVPSCRAVAVSSNFAERTAEKGETAS